MLAERNLRDYIAKKLESLGWEVKWGREIDKERASQTETLLKNRFFKAIEKINGITLTDDEKTGIFSRLMLLPPTIEGIREFLNYVKNGISFKFKREKEEIAKQIFLFDYENIKNNNFLAVKEFWIEEDGERRRFDLCLFVNGIPLVVIETKSPFRDEEEGTTWYDAYKQILEYEKAVPSIFKYIQFCIASDGYETKYFPNYFASDYADQLSTWKTYYPFTEKQVKPLKVFPYLDSTIYGMLSKQNLLDLIENFIFIKRIRDTYIKIMARWMQFKATNKIVKRVTEEKHKKLGLTWHWQGSGKTLTMAFASWKLLRNPKLEVPSIFIVVDRRDLQRQIVEEEFLPLGIEIEPIKSIRELVKILKWGGKEREGKRGIFICLIQKFKPEKLKKLHEEGEINLERENIIILTDESHRSQYGVLANVMRGIFKNAYIFGFTGTPLSKPERDTFRKFSPRGELYLDRYGMLNSIEDGFTLPIRYEARLPELHLKEEEIEELAEYEEEVLEELTPEERRTWRRKIRPKLAILKSEERIRKVCEEIANYFKQKVENTILKAMVATVDRECCVLIKKELDRLLGEKYSEIVMTYQAREKSKHIQRYKEELAKRFGHSEFERINSEIIRKFRDEEFPKILIVSDMLLTGFDCKALWVLFLYKPLKEHRLLQAIARTNRPYEEVKEFGLIVDYVGVAKNLEEALKQFEGSFVREAKLIIRDLSASEKEFEKCIKELKGMLSGIKVRGIEDVDKAVEHLIINKKEKEFEEKAKKLRRLYELLSPCETTYKHLETYKFIVCISVMLNRYRKIGMRLDEIERMARKTYRLIQKTIGVEKIEKVGEIEIDKELSKLEKEREPISAIRVLGEIQSRTIGYRSDFYISLRDEIEKIYEEMQEKRKVTKEVIEKIRRIQQKLEERKTEKKRLKEIFPVYEAMKDHLKDEKRIRKISTEIMEELKKNELLDKESFLKARQRKRIRAIVRKNLIKNFGLTPEVNEMERKIFVNLEEEYG